MNKDNAKQFLPLVQALAEGKTIQERTTYETWEDLDNPRLDRPVECYRIKPEPRRIWVNEYTDGRRYFHETEQDAKDYVNTTEKTPSRIAVEYVEVIK